jgi:hypothetical protein
MQKLNENQIVNINILDTIGKLIKHSNNLNNNLNEIIPFTIELLNDQSSSKKRQISLKTLSSIFQSTAYVINPYNDYQNLFQTLFSILNTDDDNDNRIEVLKLLGILGRINFNF